jgi:DNA-binding transcriptional ArsR family regulator
MMSEENGSGAGAGGGDAETLIALRHELRRRILRTMFEEEAPISPRRLADALHEPLSNVSYHVRVLVDCDAVTLVYKEPVRGSMEHFYSPSVEQPWALAVLGVRAEDDDPKPAAERGASTAEERFR